MPTSNFSAHHNTGSRLLIQNHVQNDMEDLDQLGSGYTLIVKAGYLTSPGRPADIGLQLGKAC